MAKESPRFAFALGAREPQQQQHGFPPQQHGFAPSRAPASFAPPGYTNTNTRQPFALHTSRPAEGPRRTSSFAPRPFATASYDSPRLAPAAHTSLPVEQQAHTARPPAQPAFPHMVSRRVVAPVWPAVIEIDQQAHNKLDYDERSDDPPEPPSDAPAPAPTVPDGTDTSERSLPSPEASRVQPQGDEFQGLFQQLGTQQATIAAMRAEKQQLADALASTRRERDGLRQTLAGTQGSVHAALARLEDYGAHVHGIRTEHEQWLAENRTLDANAGEIEELRATVAALTHEMDVMAQNKDEFVKRSDISAQLEEVKAEYDNAQQVIDLLRERQEAAGAEHGLVIEKLAAAEAATQQHRDEAQRLAHELGQERADARRHADEARRHRDEERRASDALVDANCIIARQHIELNAHKELVRQEREQVLRREREQARLEAENDAIKARMEELEKAVNSADEREAELQATLDQKINELQAELARKSEELQVGLGKKSEELATAVASANTANARLTERGHHIQSLEVSLATASSRNDRLSSALEATKTSLSGMEAQVSRMQAHEETWALQRDGMDKRLHEYDVQLTTIIEHRDTAVANSNTLNNQLIQLSQQLEFTQKQAQECENAMRYAQAENKTMADSVHQAKVVQERYDDLLAQHQLDEESRTNLQSQLQDTMEEIRSLERSLTQTQTEVAVVQGREADLRAHLAAIATAHERQDAEAHRTQRVLEAQLAERAHELQQLRDEHRTQLAAHAAEMRELRDEHRAQLARAEEARGAADAARERTEERLDVASESLRALYVAQQQAPAPVAAPAPAAVNTAELDALRMQASQQAAELKEKIAEIARLNTRTTSIAARYLANDMVPEERAFVAELLRNAQAVYERNLAGAKNDLRKSEARVEALQLQIKKLVRGEGVPNEFAVDEMEAAPPAPPPPRAASRAASRAQTPRPVAGPSRTRPAFQLLDGSDNGEDITDFDEVPVAPPPRQKRDRAPSVSKPDESTRPARRARCAPADEAKPPAKNAKSAKAAAPAEAAPASKPRARKAR